MAIIYDNDDGRYVLRESYSDVVKKVMYSSTNFVEIRPEHLGYAPMLLAVSQIYSVMPDNTELQALNRD